MARNIPTIPASAHLRFSVLAFGDSNYASFCGPGKKFDERLGHLGAQRIQHSSDSSLLDLLATQKENRLDEFLYGRAIRVEAPLSDNITQQTITPEIYFRISIGGVTGHKAFVRDLGILVSPDQILKVILALTRVYISNGNRRNRKKAHLKPRLEKWTLDQYLAETEKLLGHHLLKADDNLGEATSLTKATGADPAVHRRTTPLPRILQSHIGVFAQKQPGLNYVGVDLPIGQITPKQMLRFADIADHYVSGEIRLTVWQDRLIANIPDAFVETVKKALVKMGLNWQQSHVRSGLVACAGNSYCGNRTTGFPWHIIRRTETDNGTNAPGVSQAPGCRRNRAL